MRRGSVLGRRWKDLKLAILTTDGKGAGLASCDCPRLVCHLCRVRARVEQLVALFPQADVFSLLDFFSPADRHFLAGKTVTDQLLQRLPLRGANTPPICR